jgi:hypothetical protein
MRKLFLLLSILFLAGGCITCFNPASYSDEPLALGDVIHEINSELASVQSDMERAASDIAASGPDTARVRDLLSELYRKHHYAADLAFIDTRGIMRVVEPLFYRKLQGCDISGQAHIKQMLADKKPGMSKAFMTVEGFYAVSVQYPVLNNGVYLGSLSMLLNPESLLKSIIEQRIAGVPVDIWAMEPAGRIIYDPDAEEIGRIIFQDDLYKPFPGLLVAAHSIANSPDGSASYDFLGKGLKESVKKYAYWNTVSVYGTPWRIVLTKAEKRGVNGKKTLEELGLKSLSQAFREFVALEEMNDAIARNDQPYLVDLFKEFYLNNPGLYSVQWVDENCVNRFGFPPGNSLSNYKFDSIRDAPQSVFIQAVQEGRESFIEAPLLEGNIGQMLLCPVKPKGRYRGMVYYVRIKP